jgi:hypothetical protein
MLNKTLLDNTNLKTLAREMNPDNDPTAAVWLISLDNEIEETTAGVVVAAYVGHTRPVNVPLPPHVHTAPRCIVDKTHRLATPAEIKTHLESEKAIGIKLREEEQRRKVPFNITIQNETTVPTNAKGK